MESKLNELYPFKVWIASLLIGAVIFMVVAFFRADKDFFAGGAFLGFLFYLLLFSFSFSLPTFIVYYVCFENFGQKFRSPLIGKLIFGLIAVAGMLLTVFVLGGTEPFSPADDSSFVLWIYVASIFLASFLVRFRIREKSST